MHRSVALLSTMLLACGGGMATTPALYAQVSGARTALVPVTLTVSMSTMIPMTESSFVLGSDLASLSFPGVFLPDFTYTQDTSGATGSVRFVPDGMSADEFVATCGVATGGQGQFALEFSQIDASYTTAHGFFSAVLPAYPGSGASGEVQFDLQF